MSLLPLPPPIANNEPEIFNRLFKDGSIKRARIIRYEYQRPKHCSFNPVITKKAREIGTPRNRQKTFDKLYNQDKINRDKKNKRIRRAQTALPKKCTFKPEINKLSKKYGRNTDNYTIPIHDRLYDHGVKHLEKVDHKYRNRRPRQCTFRPSTISYGERRVLNKPGYNKPVHERLYHSARARTRRRDTINRKRAFLNREHTFTPRINKQKNNNHNSRRPESKSNKDNNNNNNNNKKTSDESPVFNRLHKQAIQHQERRSKLAARRPQYPFSPSISRRGRRLVRKSMIRGGDGDDSKPETSSGGEDETTTTTTSIVAQNGKTLLTAEERLTRKRLNMKKTIATSERLFQQAKLKQKRMRKIALENKINKPKNCTFTPRINNNNRKRTKNKGKFGDRLYSDYKKRNQRRKQRIEERDKRFNRQRRWNNKNRRINNNNNKRKRRKDNSDDDDDSSNDSAVEDGDSSDEENKSYSNNGKISPSQFNKNYNAKMKKYLEAKERRKRRANAAPSDCTFTPIINKHVKTKSLLRKFSTNIKKKKRNNNNNNNIANARRHRRRKSNAAVMKMYNDGLKEQILRGGEMVRNRNRFDTSSNNNNTMTKWTEKDIDQELDLFDSYATSNK